MKIEIISCSSPDPIETYSVSNFSMLDFQQWQEVSHQVISLSDLLKNVAKLDSRDPETREPISGEKAVDFYLPDPLKRRVFFRFDELHGNAAEDFDQSERMPEITSERSFVSVLKSSTILSSIVTEILENYSPHSDYKVRISDG